MFGISRLFAVACIVLAFSGVSFAQMSVQDAQARLRAKQPSTRPVEAASDVDALRQVIAKIMADNARLRDDNAALRRQLAEIKALVPKSALIKGLKRFPDPDDTKLESSTPDPAPRTGREDATGPGKSDPSVVPDNEAVKNSVDEINMKMAKFVLGKSIADLQFIGFRAVLINENENGSDMYRLHNKDTEWTVKTNAEKVIVTSRVEDQFATSLK